LTEKVTLYYEFVWPGIYIAEPHLCFINYSYPALPVTSKDGF